MLYVEGFSYKTRDFNSDQTSLAGSAQFMKTMTTLLSFLFLGRRAKKDGTRQF
jgi:hypothetical protein